MEGCQRSFSLINLAAYCKDNYNCAWMFMVTCINKHIVMSQCMSTTQMYTTRQAAIIWLDCHVSHPPRVVTDVRYSAGLL